MLKEHSKLIVSLILAIGIGAVVWLYIANATFTAPVTAAAPPMPELKLEVPQKPEPSEKREAAAPPAPKEERQSRKTEEDRYKSKDKALAGKGAGGGEKGFASFWCEAPRNSRELLRSLKILGVREFVLLKKDAISGVAPFDENGLRGYKPRPPASTDGLQRLLSEEEIASLGLNELIAAAGIEQPDQIGFYLRKRVVSDALNRYAERHGIPPAKIISFYCKYTIKGFEVLDVYTDSEDGSRQYGFQKLAARPLN